jgi:hypothetical protein
MANYRYGSTRYGAQPYGGLSPATIIPTRNVSGITFLTSNDRYQVVACSYGGTLDTPPEFRYWYAAPAPWAEELNQDEYLPPYHTADEDGTTPAGTLELPYRRIKSPQEMTASGVVVEFIPRPTAIAETLDSMTVLGFSVQIEGQGVADYTRAGAGALTSGVTRSDILTFAEDTTDQESSTWPNIRTVYLPCRIRDRLRAARVLVTDITLCEILSVQLIGKTDHTSRLK